MTKIIDSFDQVFKTEQRVLMVAAHPDDNEVICGGLVARLISSGKQVRLVVVTNGEKGTEGRSIPPAEFANIRLTEQLAAGEALGLARNQNFNLGIPDGELEPTVENIGKIVWHIRDFKPDLVIAHNPQDFACTFSEAENIRWINHRDHRHSGQITVDAVYPYSRDRGFSQSALKTGSNLTQLPKCSGQTLILMPIVSTSTSPTSTTKNALPSRPAPASFRPTMSPNTSRKPKSASAITNNCAI